MFGGDHYGVGDVHEGLGQGRVAAGGVLRGFEQLLVEHVAFDVISQAGFDVVIDQGAIERTIRIKYHVVIKRCSERWFDVLHLGGEDEGIFDHGRIEFGYVSYGNDFEGSH